MWLWESLQALFSMFSCLPLCHLKPEHALRGKQATQMLQTYHSRCSERAHTLWGNCHVSFFSVLYCILFIFMCMHVCTYKCHGMLRRSEDKPILSGFVLSFPPHGFGGSSSGHQAWRQMPLPTKLSHPPSHVLCTYCF